jgi:hypothetical protein
MVLRNKIKAFKFLIRREAEERINEGNEKY